MKINKYILLALTIVTLFVTSCEDDNGGNNNTDSVVFEAAPTFSASFSANNRVEVITEGTVRYHVVLLLNGNFTVTMVETATGLILVDVGPDATFIENAGTELRGYADAIGKPLSIIMTHNHFDHWGNMDSFTDVTVYAHSDVAPFLIADPGFTAKYGEDNLDSVIAVSSSQEIGGLTFNFESIKSTEIGEDGENGYVYIPSVEAVFVADLAYNRAHNFIRAYTPLDGTDEIDNWVAGLEDVLIPKFGSYSHIFCGHNGTRTDVTNIINENIEYLRLAQDLISGERLLSTGVQASTAQEIVDELLIIYPNYVQSGLLFALPGAFGATDPGADWFE